MTTTSVLVTALPWSRADDAPHHLTAFVTHKLVPESPDATVAAFPATADWGAVVTAGRFELVTSAGGAPLPLTVVGGADAAAWRAAVPPSTPVAGFPAPVLSDATVTSLPAHRLSDEAVDLHLMSLTAAPTTRPGVVGSPVLEGTFQHLAETHRALRELLVLAGERAERSTRLAARRLAEAQATLGAFGGRDRTYPREDLTTRSAIEVLLDDAEGDARVTAMLDDMLAAGGVTDDPHLQVLLDAHATRRYYQRSEAATAYRPEPLPDAAPPRPTPPVPDVHARLASFGSTPALLRRLGLAVDLRLADVAVLDGVTWVAVRFVPPEGAEVTMLAPPRTRVVVDGDVFRARSSSAWVAGALPLGDEAYVVLDLDPDAAGLKLEQHLRDLPRAVATEVNGDPATSAPGSLRATGFAIARSDRVAATRERLERAEGLTTPADGPGVVGPELDYDDLVRGVRLEVWDDATRTWHSLHRRRVDATADPGDGTPAVPVLADEPDVGFLQQSGLNRVPGDDTNPYYLHEVVAGWDGWSLSAPRPGRVVVHEDGEERVLEAPPDEPATGVHVRTRVDPGTLPALRYGRSYAFRMVGVDLGGASVRADRPARRAGGRPVLADEAAAAHLERLRRVYAARDGAGLVAAVRDRVLAALPGEDAEPDWFADAARLGEERQRFRRPVREGLGRLGGFARPGRRGDADATAAERVRAWVPAVARTGDLEIDLAVAERLERTARDRLGVGTGPTTVPGPGTALTGAQAGAAFRDVARATRRLAEQSPTWRVRPQLGVDAATFAEVAGWPGGPGGVPEPEVARRPTVTVPRPYLRWEPVLPPSLVARTALGTGEQLSRLVVRTGLAPTSPDAAPTSERHLVPPKATQLECETAGLFDRAMGSTDPAEHRAAYAIALRERGTLLDRYVPDLDAPGAVVEQPGIALLARPGADPATLVTLDQIAAQRDTPLGEGQYVVHDVDQLTLPYLADPFAAGVALVFYDAGAPHVLPEPRVLQAVVLPFEGEWPRVRPFRLVLEPAVAAAPGAEPALGARLDGTTIRVALPAGEQVRLALSSSVRRADLAKLGLWRSHLASTIDPDGDGTATPADVVAAAVLLRAAESGWTWWLTPSVDVRLVHAVPAPVRAPEILALRVAMRPPGLTVAQLAGVVDVHGSSTDRLTVRAAWTEEVDDVAAPGPATVRRDDVVVSSAVAERERFGLLTLIDFLPFGPGADALALSEGGLGMHRALQTFPDTHHRRVTYTPSGTTRFRELFTAEDLPGDDDPTLAGAPVELVVPSAARPTAPDLVDAVPLLRWEETTEPEQPFGLRRTRRSGVRVWLRRPWYSSGDGELLGVVLSTTGTEPERTISLWGRDPVYLGAPTGSALTPPLVEVGHLVLEAVGGAVVDRAARPVLPAATVPLVDLPAGEGGPALGRVLAYRPEYHPGRGQWFVDVALDDGPALWPFVRLAVARYQPDSIAGCHLSPVGLTSWVQPLPTRTATVNRPDEARVRVTVSGAVAFLRGLRRDGGDEQVPVELDADTPTGATALVDQVLARSRTVHATVQVLPDGATDLEWRTVSSRRLPVVGVGPSGSYRVTWSADLALPHPGARDVPLELRTPGSQPRWRVLVEERELLDADPVDEPNLTGTPTRTSRVVYADAIPL